jgi:hypothetical protein
MTFVFRRTRNGEKECGVVSGDSPATAMQRVLGSHPIEHGVTYAFVYLPDENDDPNSDYSLEWPREK